MKIISKNCGNLKELIQFKNIICNSNENFELMKKSKNIIILGNFDGVHKGHKQILRKAVKKAKELGYKTVVYTFGEHPTNTPFRITTTAERLYLIEEEGIDYIYLEEFDNVKNYSPEQFVSNILIEKLNAVEIYCGFNFTFGKNKIGNIDTLNKLSIDNNIKLNVESPVLDSDNDIVSSTRIREYIQDSNFAKLKELLTHNYIIMGEVVHGKKLGRTLGFPTANLKFVDKLYPGFGVYGAYIHIEGEDNIYHGVINIGKNPTVEFNGLTIEAHIYNFDKDIYGKIIIIEVLEKVSEEKKLNSLDELIHKIDNDKIAWRKKIDEKYYDTNKNR